MKTESMTMTVAAEEDAADPALLERGSTTMPLARSSTVSGSRIVKAVTSSSLRRSFSARSFATHQSLHFLEGETILFPIPFGHESHIEHDQRQRWESLFDPNHTFTGSERPHSQLRSAGGANDGFHHAKEDEEDAALEEPTLPSQQLPSGPHAPSTTSNTAMPVPPCDEGLLKDRLELLHFLCSQTILTGAPAHATRKVARQPSFSVSRWPRPGKGDDLEALKEVDEKTDVEPDPRLSTTLLLFLLGFLFPPIWIVGALYTPPAPHLRSPATQRTDRLWRRRSRIAFCVAAIVLMLILVLVLVLKPGSLGWRHTKEKSTQIFVPVRPDTTLSSTPMPPTPIL